MKIYVINLKKDLERKNQAKKQLDKLNISYEFFLAIDAKEHQEKLIKKVDSKKFLINSGRNYTLGEIGCYESHAKIWQIAKEKNINILVLEDDFVLKNNFLKAFEILKKNINKYGFIRIEEEKRSSYLEHKKFDDFSIMRYTKPTQGATAYAISPKIADIFLKKSKTIVFPVDYLLRHFYFNNIYIFRLFPAVVKKADVSSSIGQLGVRKKAKKNIKIRILRLAMKIKTLLYLSYFNIKFYWKKNPY